MYTEDLLVEYIQLHVYGYQIFKYELNSCQIPTKLKYELLTLSKMIS